MFAFKTTSSSAPLYLQVRLNKLECRGKLVYFSNSTQIVLKLKLGFRWTQGTTCTLSLLCCNKHLHQDIKLSSSFFLTLSIFWCYFLQDMHHVTKPKSSQTGFLEHDNEFTLLQMASTVTRSQSGVLIMDVQPTNLQQLCDAIISIWTNISEECFQHLVESMPRIIKGPTPVLARCA